jgi:Zn-dependent M28 family amino/carboxypeptidase
MGKDGLQNVTTPPVEVQHWVRGDESAEILSPIKKKLHLLGLGRSIGTPPKGLRGEVVVVSNFDELAGLGREGVTEKIVVYNAVFESYGKTVQYRSSGASKAAELGASAALVRSVTPVSLESPHTGATRYTEGVKKIPFAAISIEDAELLQRLTDAGERVEVQLNMGAQTLPPTTSANVIGEIVGWKKPDEVVVIGGHIDSWDVGQGAHDDGVGVVVAMQAARLLLDLGLKPRRTVRVVLWTNEENGLAGGRAYREWIGDEIAQHRAAIEMDSGAEKPVGFGWVIRRDELAQQDADHAFDLVSAIGDLLSPLEADEVVRGGGGADISPLTREGVPGLGLRTVGEHYFDWHHTEADTIDKVNLKDLRAALAAMTVMAYVLADMPGDLLPPLTLP